MWFFPLFVDSWMKIWIFNNYFLKINIWNLDVVSVSIVIILIYKILEWLLKRSVCLYIKTWLTTKWTCRITSLKLCWLLRCISFGLSLICLYLSTFWFAIFLICSLLWIWWTIIRWITWTKWNTFWLSIIYFLLLSLLIICLTEIM